MLWQAATERVRTFNHRGSSTHITRRTDEEVDGTTRIRYPVDSRVAPGRRNVRRQARRHQLRSALHAVTKGATPRSAVRETKASKGLRRPGFHHAIVEGFTRGDGEMFPSKCERTCNFPPLDRTGPRDKGSRGRNVRSRCRCSLSPAIRISSRGWPRSSSTDEPSDPPSRVFSVFVFLFIILFWFWVCTRG